MPGRARAGKTKKTKVCGMPLVGKNYGKWHGKNKEKLDKLEDKVKEKLISGNYSIIEKYELLGAMLHSIQDNYAHSYVVSIDFYREHFKAFKEGSAAVNYHNDRERIEGENEEVVGLKKIDFKIHAEYKDNERKDFDKRKDFI